MHSEPSRPNKIPILFLVTSEDDGAAAINIMIIHLQAALVLIMQMH